MTTADIEAAAHFVAVTRRSGVFPTEQGEASAALYGWYLNPMPLPAHTGPIHPSDLNLPAALDAAHIGATSFSGGWRAESVSTWGRAAATRDGVTRLLHRNQYRVPRRPGLRAEPGDALLVNSAWTWIDEATGFWMSRVGPWPPEGADRLIRVYWNVVPDHTPGLVSALTNLLWDRGVSSAMMKTPASADHVGRADAFVLYLAPESFTAVKDVFVDHVDVPLRAPTPRFTRRLEDGLAYSEGPLNGDSFGDACCTAMTRALLRTERARQTADSADIVKILTTGFVKAGYDPNRLYRLPRVR
jgi:hypothetical protein